MKIIYKEYLRYNPTLRLHDSNSTSTDELWYTYQTIINRNKITGHILARSFTSAEQFLIFNNYAL